MAFSNNVSVKALVSCGRHCCLCHKFCGIKIELHHIKQKADGGEDTFENCIPLCFDCHAEVQAYNSKHPKGRKFTVNELIKHRDRWYDTVLTNGNRLNTGDLESKVSGLETSVNLILEKLEQTSNNHISKNETYKNDEFIEEVFNPKSIPTGFSDLDNLIGGLNQSELVVIASAPSMGKSDFALTIAKNVSVFLKETVAFFSLESTSSNIIRNLIAATGKVDKSRIRSGCLEAEDWDRLVMAVEGIHQSSLFINDESDINVEEILEKCARVHPKVIIIDNLNLLNCDDSQSDFEVNTRNIKKLKSLAKKLKCSVVVLASLAPIHRLDKRPLISDLKDLGSIESVADIIILLHQEVVEYDSESYKKNITEVIVAKHRNGRMGLIELAYFKQYGLMVTIGR
ncbi:hypothetical protein FE782_12910 [Paenibacillus antri]|uniref:SF4 helicase domain-containing protein n=1 Tax=Paenibacillus antri TaxID=2582848 RepID=A0A5R9G600_9BACL|nr:DnaB-like helicase C-terminal domain-containing protein [Paenibacillus antri]TLS51807.1 hypothetical protein FE782_12910 [Paenibacillus antri]